MLRSQIRALDLLADEADSDGFLLINEDIEQHIEALEAAIDLLDDREEERWARVAPFLREPVYGRLLSTTEVYEDMRFRAISRGLHLVAEDFRRGVEETHKALGILGYTPPGKASMPLLEDA